MRHVGEDFDQSLFQAAGMEVPVGPDGMVHPAPLTAQDGTPVVIRGKIDRVDLFAKGRTAMPGWWTTNPAARISAWKRCSMA